MQQRQRWVAALALIATATLPIGGATEPISELQNPLQNGGFELGSPVTVDTSIEPVGFVVKQVGSVAPGETENRSYLAAAGWTVHVFSGQRAPESIVRWATGIGTPFEPVHDQLPQYLRPYAETGALEIHYDESDRGAHTLTISQAMGQRPHAGTWFGATDVSVTARTPFGHPLFVRAAVATVEEPWLLTFTDRGEIVSGNYATYTLPFDRPTGTITEFFLFIWGASGTSQDTVIYLDDVIIEGAELRVGTDLDGGIVEPWRREVCRLTEVCV